MGPRSRFVGYDFSDQALVAARAEVTAWGPTNARSNLEDDPFDVYFVARP